MSSVELYRLLALAIAKYAPHQSWSFTLHLENDEGAVDIGDAAPHMKIACMSLSDPSGGDSQTSVWYVYPGLCMVLPDASPEDTLVQLGSAMHYNSPILAGNPETLASLALLGE